MKSYIAKSAEDAKRLHDLKEGEEAKIWIPCKMQPPDKDCILVGRCGKILWIEKDGYRAASKLFNLPLILNVPIYVREAWCDYYLDKVLKYIVKSNCADWDIWQAVEKWQSPATMPKDAARTWITPVSVEVKRVQELGSGDVWIGICKYFKLNSESKREKFWDSNPYIFYSRLKKNNMTHQEAKKIVQDKYPNARAHIPPNGWYVTSTDSNYQCLKWKYRLSDYCSSENEAWINAAERILKQQTEKQ